MSIVALWATCFLSQYQVNLEDPLTYSELLFCLKKSSKNTSPGYDGFSYEFLKCSGMLRALNYGINNGELFDSQNEG